jgi:hypothetical protein
VKKSTAYGRRMRRAGINPATDTVISNSWINAVQRCRVYTDEPIPGASVVGSLSGAHTILLHVRTALDDLLHHRVAPGNARPYEELAMAVDVAHIRAIQIQPDTGNPAHVPLHEAKAVLYRARQRRERAGVWGLSGPDRETLMAAIDIYEALLLSSSPQQMHAAERMRMDSLERGHLWRPDGDIVPRTESNAALSGSDAAGGRSA